MKKVALASIIGLMASTISAQQINQKFLEPYPSIGPRHLLYDLDFVHCTVGFSIRHMGWSIVSGSFSRFEGAVVYDTNDPAATLVTFAVDVTSVDTNQKWRDKDLNSEKWFNSDKHPYILFQSKKGVSKNQGFDLVGDLTIKGVTQEVTLHMEPPSGYFKSYLGYELAFNGIASINRKEFGVGENTWWNDLVDGIAQLDDSVDIQLSIIYQLQSPEFIKSRFFENEMSIYKAMMDRGAEAAIDEFEQQKFAYDQLELKDNTDFSAITAKDLNTVGLALILEGREELAQELFEHNIKAFPHDDGAILPLALLRFKQQDYTETVRLIEHSLKLNPYNPVALEISRQLKK
jgi:polyisoprenoid-binding protein YceI